MTSLSKWEALAIKDINSSAEFVAKNIDNIRWVNGTDAISKSDIQTKANELETIYDAQQYSRDRAKEYPPIADQLDDIYHNGIDAWKATIKVTKDKYPK